MGIAEVLILALGVSMDALAVAICKGLALKRVDGRGMLTVGLWFGGFQTLMPLLGYLLGIRFSALVHAYDHWIAFVLLGALGAGMIREALRGGDEPGDSALNPHAMFPLAVATSIDALAVGVTFACLNVDVGPAVTLIGLVTFAISAAGVKLGSLAGAKCQGAAGFIGGAILSMIGLKILLDHLGVI